MFKTGGFQPVFPTGPPGYWVRAPWVLGNGSPGPLRVDRRSLASVGTEKRGLLCPLSWRSAARINVILILWKETLKELHERCLGSCSDTAGSRVKITHQDTESKAILHYYFALSLKQCFGSTIKAICILEMDQLH